MEEKERRSEREKYHQDRLERVWCAKCFDPPTYRLNIACRKTPHGPKCSKCPWGVVSVVSSSGQRVCYGHARNRRHAQRRLRIHFQVVLRVEGGDQCWVPRCHSRHDPCNSSQSVIGVIDGGAAAVGVYIARVVENSLQYLDVGSGVWPAIGSRWNVTGSSAWWHKWSVENLEQVHALQLFSIS